MGEKKKQGGGAHHHEHFEREHPAHVPKTQARLGHRSEKQHRCPNCGAFIRSKHVVCHECGARLR